MVREYVANCECGFTGTYDSRWLADYALDRHSCTYARRLAAIDRTPKACLHRKANHQHGTYACYRLDGCRCPPCGKALSDYNRQHAYGRHAPLVDAEPTRRHIHDLMLHGMGLKRIAAACGVSHSSLAKLIYGTRQADGSRRRSKRVTAETAERVQDVGLDLADGASINGHGTSRRLQALVARGWSQARLAARLGMLPSNLGPIVQGTSSVRVATASAVVTLYDELSNEAPPQGTRGEKAAASRARNLAAERGW